MYNQHLDTFIVVADTGSFSKAAEQLFISPTAVVKKINSLEQHLGVTLFIRTHQGVILTAAGKDIYKDAKTIINYSNTAVARAKRSERMDSGEIRIGKSLNTPADMLEDIWPKIHQYCPDLALNIIPFENNTEAVDNMFMNLGKDMDAYIGLIDPTMLSYRKCIGLRLRTEPLKVAVTADHPLAGKKHLRIRDFYGQKLMLVQKGRFACYDRLREELTAHHPKIEILDCETIEINAFNACNCNRCGIVIIDPWEKIHPLFHTIPVAWEFTGDWGIVCARNPSPLVQRFLDTAEKVMNLSQEDRFYGKNN